MIPVPPPDVLPLGEKTKFFQVKNEKELYFLDKKVDFKQLNILINKHIKKISIHVEPIIEDLCLCALFFKKNTKEEDLKNLINENYIISHIGNVNHCEFIECVVYKSSHYSLIEKTRKGEYNMSQDGYFCYLKWKKRNKPVSIEGIKAYSTTNSGVEGISTVDICVNYKCKRSSIIEVECEFTPFFKLISKKKDNLCVLLYGNSPSSDDLTTVFFLKGKKFFEFVNCSVKCCEVNPPKDNETIFQCIPEDLLIRILLRFESPKNVFKLMKKKEIWHPSKHNNFIEDYKKIVYFLLWLSNQDSLFAKISKDVLIYEIIPYIEQRSVYFRINNELIENKFLIMMTEKKKKITNRLGDGFQLYAYLRMIEICEKVIFSKNESILLTSLLLFVSVQILHKEKILLGLSHKKSLDCKKFVERSSKLLIENKGKKISSIQKKLLLIAPLIISNNIDFLRCDADLKDLFGSLFWLIASKEIPIEIRRKAKFLVEILLKNKILKKLIGKDSQIIGNFVIENANSIINSNIAIIEEHNSNKNVDFNSIINLFCFEVIKKVVLLEINVSEKNMCDLLTILEKKQKELVVSTDEISELSIDNVNINEVKKKVERIDSVICSIINILFGLMDNQKILYLELLGKKWNSFINFLTFSFQSLFYGGFYLNKDDLVKRVFYHQKEIILNFKLNDYLIKHMFSDALIKLRNILSWNVNLNENFFSMLQLLLGKMSKKLFMFHFQCISNAVKTFFSEIIEIAKSCTDEGVLDFVNVGQSKVTFESVVNLLRNRISLIRKFLEISREKEVEDESTKFVWEYFEKFNFLNEIEISIIFLRRVSLNEITVLLKEICSVNEKTLKKLNLFVKMMDFFCCEYDFTHPTKYLNLISPNKRKDEIISGVVFLILYYQENEISKSKDFSEIIKKLNGVLKLDFNEYSKLFSFCVLRIISYSSSFKVSFEFDLNVTEPLYFLDLNNFCYFLEFFDWIGYGVHKNRKKQDLIISSSSGWIEFENSINVIVRKLDLTVRFINTCLLLICKNWCACSFFFGLIFDLFERANWSKINFSSFCVDKIVEVLLNELKKLNSKMLDDSKVLLYYQNSVFKELNNVIECAKILLFFSKNNETKPNINCKNFFNSCEVILEKNIDLELNSILLGILENIICYEREVFITLVEKIKVFGFSQCSIFFNISEKFLEKLPILFFEPLFPLEAMIEKLLRIFQILFNFRIEKYNTLKLRSIDMFLKILEKVKSDKVFFGAIKMISEDSIMVPNDEYILLLNCMKNKMSINSLTFCVVEKELKRREEKKEESETTSIFKSKKESKTTEIFKSQDIKRGMEKGEVTKLEEFFNFSNCKNKDENENKKKDDDDINSTLVFNEDKGETPNDIFTFDPLMNNETNNFIY